MLEQLMPSQIDDLEKSIDQSGIPKESIEQARVDGAWAGYIMGHEETPAYIHKASKYYFAIDLQGEAYDQLDGLVDPGGYLVEYSPAQYRPTELVRNLEWPDVVKRFRQWLSYVRRELKIPDPLPPGTEPLRELLEWSKKQGGGKRSSPPVQPPTNTRPVVSQSQRKPVGPEPASGRAAQPTGRTHPLEPEEISLEDVWGAVKRLKLGAAIRLGGLLVGFLFAVATATWFVAHLVDQRRIDMAESRADSTARAAATLRDSLATLRRGAAPVRRP